MPASPDPQGLGFDDVAEDYDRGRPGWPDAMLDGVEGESVCDLAAGTGKLTALLVRRYDQVTAVEPLAGMRAVLTRNVPDCACVAGSAERIPLDDASVDAVFVAEAFHWFDSEVAAREIARVLRRGGTLVVCFNEWREPWTIGDAARAALEARWARLPPPGGRKVETGAWKEGLGGAAFGPLRERAIDHEWTTDREGVASYYVSTSSMGALPPDERAALRAELVSLLEERDYRLGLTARVHTTERR